MSVRIGIAPTALPPGREGADLFWRCMALCNDLGIDSVWLSDRPTGPRVGLDPLTALAAVVGRYPRMKLGTSVLIASLRQPVLLAKELATLDYLSGGRVFPAVGLGQDDPREYEAFGVSKADRGRRADEAIGLLRRLWTEDSVTHHGRHFTLNDVTVTPKPVQQGGIPIWTGGRTEAAQRRVGRLGDGWLASAATPAEMAHGIRVVFEAAAQAGRTVEEDHIGAILGFRFARTRAEAAEQGASFVTRPRPDADAADYSALGDANAIAEKIDEYVQAGVSKFVLRPLGPPEVMEDQLRRLGEEIIPRFHQTTRAVASS